MYTSREYCLLFITDTWNTLPMDFHISLSSLTKYVNKATYFAKKLYPYLSSPFPRCYHSMEFSVNQIFTIYPFNGKRSLWKDTFPPVCCVMIVHFDSQKNWVNIDGLMGELFLWISHFLLFVLLFVLFSHQKQLDNRKKLIFNFFLHMVFYDNTARKKTIYVCFIKVT